jgi:hypothetical protein
MAVSRVKCVQTKVTNAACELAFDVALASLSDDRDESLMEQMDKIDSIWSLSVLAIAAPDAGTIDSLISGREKRRSSAAPRRAGMPIVVVICVLGSVPILSNAHVEWQRSRSSIACV